MMMMMMMMMMKKEEDSLSRPEQGCKISGESTSEIEIKQCDKQVGSSLKVFGGMGRGAALTGGGSGG